MMVRDDKNYVFITIGGGLHRTAAMAALDYETIPATFIIKNYFIDIKDVNYWPQVKTQFRQPDEAKSYVEYLFSFDSLEWAERNILNDGNS